jgi:hypothetical protein
MTFHPRGAEPGRAMESLLMAAILLLTVYLEMDTMEKSLLALMESVEVR